jgi:hypothetical protein
MTTRLTLYQALNRGVSITPVYKNSPTALPPIWKDRPITKQKRDVPDNYHPPIVKVLVGYKGEYKHLHTIQPDIKGVLDWTETLNIKL